MTLQVTYASDVEAAMKIMQEVAAAQPRVQTTPSVPQVHLLGFGDNGYQLEMHLWIADPEKGQENLKSAINRSILKRFRDADIHIARPEREFRLISPATGTDLASAEGTPAGPPTG
jgi:small-conductance mechanosensitive channel